MRRKEIESGRTNEQKTFYAPTFDAYICILCQSFKGSARQPPPSQLHGSEVYVINIFICSQGRVWRLPI